MVWFRLEVLSRPINLIMSTVKFYTLGCKVNQYETQAIREQFERAGFKEVCADSSAKVCVVNTCTVTHRADRDSLRFIRKERAKHPNTKIVVTGCLAEFDVDKIKILAPNSLIVKNKEKKNILSLLKVSSTRFVLGFESCSITYFKHHSRAFLKVQDGCNYRCSYCKVSLVRGSSRSRRLDEIKQEAQALVQNGYAEIVLSGICLGSYGKDLTPKISLVEIIRELEKIKGDFSIRLSSIEARDITTELLNLLAKSKKMCRHLHIPLQSGDDRILKLMNRTYTPEKYIEIIALIRKKMPDIAITTDVIVGFPGETESNFENTVKMLKKIKPSHMHIFSYSKRLGTSAYTMGNFVDENKIKLRQKVLSGLAKELRLKYWNKFCSQVRSMVIEDLAAGSDTVWQGLTDNYIKVKVSSKLSLAQRKVYVKLQRVKQDFVQAKIVNKH